MGLARSAFIGMGFTNGEVEKVVKDKKTPLAFVSLVFSRQCSRIRQSYISLCNKNL